MLGYIRDRAQGWVAWLIVGVLIIPFALWGINQYFTGEGKATVAKVNDVEISLRQYQQALQFQRDRVRSMMGERANADMIDQLVKPADVVQNLVENEVLIQVAQNTGFHVSEKDLIGQIHDIPAFQQEGKFSKELYETLLRSQGDTPATFEARLQRAVMTRQLNTGIMQTALVTDYDVAQYVRLKQQNRQFRYVEIAAQDFLSDTEVEDAVLRKYFDDNADRYSEQEKVKLEYVELKAEDLVKNVVVKDEELRTLYEEEKNQFGVDEERKASHILVQVDGDADDDTRAKAKSKAEDLLQQLNKGAEFAKLAKEFSDDPGSAEQGGDLGFFGRGIMTPAFEEATYALKKGELSPVVETSFGYHIIRLDDLNPGTLKPFETVRGELEDMYRTRKAEMEFYDLSENLTNLAYETPDSLVAVNETLGLEIKMTGFFTRFGGGSGVTNNPKVKTAAFSADVLKEGYNSEPIEIGLNHMVVVRVNEHQETRQKSFDEVKDQLVKAVKQEQAEEKARELGDTVLAALQTGTSLEELVKQHKLVLQTSKTVARGDTSIDRSIGASLFKMAPPAEEKSSYELVTMFNGNQALVQLMSVSDGSVEGLKPEEKQKIKDELANNTAMTTYAHYVEDLKSQADISVYLNNIQ